MHHEIDRQNIERQKECRHVNIAQRITLQYM
jgi:hypothetical protein